MGGTMEFQQSKTYANLLTAYNTELMACGQYAVFSDRARTEGLIEISQLFGTISLEEKAHAVIWLRQLNNGSLPTTEQNLSTSLAEEKHAGNDMYREFARVAREEGYNELSALFNGVANIELNHDLELQNRLQNLVNGTLFCKEDEMLWVCINCGNIMSGNCAPEICPVCEFPQGYYKVFVNQNV